MEMATQLQRNLNILISLVVASTTITQTFQINRLQKDNLLDTYLLRSLYNVFYGLLLSSTVGMLAFNYHYEVQILISHTASLIIIFLVVLFQGLRSFTTKNENLIYFNSSFETTQLLSSSENATPMVYESYGNNRTKSIPNEVIGKLGPGPDDISPISSLSKYQSFQGLSNTKMPKEDMSKLKSPILATLLYADGASAFNLQLLSTELITTDAPTSIFKVIFVLFIASSFILSQLIYSLAIFKTNMYTSPKKQYSIFGLNLLISLILLISTSTHLPLSFIFTFTQENKLLDRIIPIFFALQSTISLILQIYFHFRGETGTFKRFSFYDSSPAHERTGSVEAA